MVASFALSNVRDAPLKKIVALGALALACTGREDFFKEPANLGGRAGAATGSGGKETTGQGGASGSNGSKGGTAGQGDGAGGSDGGTSAGAKSGDGGDQSGAAGLGASAGGPPSAGSPGAGGNGASGSGAGGRAPTAGDTGAESGAAGDGTAGDPGSGGTGGEPCVPDVERCDGVSNDCDELVDEGGVCPVGCEAKVRDDTLYLLCLFEDPDDQLAYAAAGEACENAGEKLELTLELTRLDSAAENAFVKAWIDASTTVEGTVWIGANDLDEERRWVWGRAPNEVQFFTASRLGGGTPYLGRFNDFAPDRPNATNGAEENCGAFDATLDWQWNDLICSVPRLGFTCEQAP